TAWRHRGSPEGSPLGVLEPYEWKRSRTVLRGAGAGNRPRPTRSLRQTARGMEMQFRKTLINNWIIWSLMAINGVYMMYSRFHNAEVNIQTNGGLFSVVLICEALFLFVLLFCVERFLFRKSRIRRFGKDEPKRIVIPFYFSTILGTAFAQASIVWGSEALKATGDSGFMFVLYGISIVFLGYFFPWRWRLATESARSEPALEPDA
ncbi:MAG: hypothetical protein AB1578_17270, partial [Thermodesulfobacteriota bacterium]